MTDLTPGPELDRRVAEAVGWLWNGRPGYDCATCSCQIISCHVSERLGDEIEVLRYPSGSDTDALAALEATGLDWDIVRKGSRYDVSIEWEESTQWANGYGETIPLAICAAILAWKEGQEDE